MITVKDFLDLTDRFRNREVTVHVIGGPDDEILLTAKSDGKVWVMISDIVISEISADGDDEFSIFVKSNGKGGELYEVVKNM